MKKEDRAYSAKELEVLVKGSSTPTVVDWKRAVRAVTRGDAGYDAIRKDLVGRAQKLGVNELVPSNWNADGSLESKAGIWTDQESRETHGDLAVALSDALEGLVDDMDGVYYGWLQDFDDENMYFQAGGLLYSASYVVADGGPVTLGDPTRVRPVTSYVPAEDDLERSEAKPERRLASRTLEWRKERAPKRLDRETREIARPFELRDEDDGDTCVLRSYASLFDEPYTVGSGSYRYQETVLPGAFKRTLNNGPDVVFRAEHGGPPLARTSSGTLTVGEDETGLWYEASLSRADPDVQRLIPKIERGDYRESSFAFRCVEDAWNDDYSKRSLKACDLDRGDVSIVTFGASRATGKHMLLRSEEEAILSLRSGGVEVLLAALVEWRDFTLTPLEDRAGKAISASNLATLKHVLSLAASADEALDEIQPTLADLMGVPNPDADDDATEENADKTEPVEERVELPKVPALPASSLRDLRRELRRRAA
jgi:HK97 family phage prohead protease